MQLAEARVEARGDHDLGDGPIELTVVMPCLNEALTLGTCIEKARRAMDEAGIAGEVVIADNGSTDGSQEIAERLGARVVAIPTKGYGAALMGGIRAARGRYVIMGDSDDSYDFGHIPRFVERLRAGDHLVMGNRFRGGIAPGAMKPLHRYLGNPVLTAIGRLFFASPCGDFHCGLRAFGKQAAEAMDLQTTGMEFASEMVIKATLLRMRIAEVPTTLSPDGRDRPPHLRSWRDGWRHLRFMLMYSPRWLFLYPGLALMALGLVTMLALLGGPRQFLGVVLDVHTLSYAAMTVVVGFQLVTFAIFAKIYAVTTKLMPPDPRLDRLFGVLNLETGLLAGIALLAVGLLGSVAGLWAWGQQHFGSLDPSRTLRVVIPSGVAIVLGVQTMFSSFFLSLLGMGRKA